MVRPTRRPAPWPGHVPAPGLGKNRCPNPGGNTGAGPAGEDGAVCSRSGSAGHVPLSPIRDLPALAEHLAAGDHGDRQGSQGRARTESVSRSLQTSDAHAPARRSKASPRPMPRGLRLESTRRPADATFSLCQHPRRSRASEAAAVCPYTDLKRQHHTPAAFPTAPPYSLQLHTGISRNGAAFREQNSVGPDCLAPMLNMRSTSKVS